MNAFQLILIVGSISFASVESSLPSQFIDKGACPFECCTYGNWIAKSDIDIVNIIGDTKPSERVLAGEKIKALTGEFIRLQMKLKS